MNPNKIRREKIMMTILWFLPVLFLLTLLFLYETNQASVFLVNKSPIKIHPSINLIDPFEDLKLDAKAVLVRDINTGEILFERNSQIALPIASITKIMTALVTKNLGQKINSVYISSNFMKDIYKDDFLVGESFKLNNMIDYMLVSSSNNAAAAVAFAVQNNFPSESFVSKMNATAQKIGMKNTYFLNETGLDENPGQAGAFGSAQDVAQLIEYTLKYFPEYLEATRESNISTYSDNGILHQATNTNIIVNELPNLLASKTGYTDMAGGNLAVIIDPALNRPISIVVLGSTQDGRFYDVLSLSNAVSKYFSLKP